ncbi:DUF1850 domain-containing protein [Thermococcus sp.]|uniref:DUF1850 domain-containing protein n=1 Tax=Thermococcus sp. TaxID=35749 RepID=UPI002626329E|nr:DUF1850 domain-containing protein [Thermococcus sp.]
MSRKILSFLIIGFIIALFFPVNAVQISYEGRSYLFPTGSEIKIDYIHSVERIEVVEFLIGNSSGFYAVGMEWGDFGAGLPEDIQGEKDGNYYKHCDDYLGRDFQYWFIPINHVNITVNNVTVLRSPSKPLLVNFRVKKVPLVVMMIRRW